MACSFETVREIAGKIDGTEEGTSYGTPAFKIGGKLFARLKEDNETLVVAMDIEQRTEVLAADSSTYYLTDHYVKYPYILVRLPRVHRDALRDLLGGAARFVMKKRKAKHH